VNGESIEWWEAHMEDTWVGSRNRKKKKVEKKKSFKVIRSWVCFSSSWVALEMVRSNPKRCVKHNILC
jgi:predicted alpha-1,6-mannanase (GH76 family)